MNVYEKNTVEFVTVGVEFCAFIEKAGEKSFETFVPVLQKLLPFLYLKAAMVEKPIVLGEDELGTYVTEVDYETIRATIANILEDKDDFFNGQEPMSISECVADVYQDIKDFISNYKTGMEDVMNDAIEKCIDNFQTYWGGRLLEALNAIHKISYTETDELC
jgi:hypothetical protein